MENKKTEIAQKIQKLLKLSESPNEVEAALALKKVDEILSKYNMTLSDVEIKAEEYINEIIDETSRIRYSWYKSVINNAARTFYCKNVLSYGTGGYHKERLLGSKADVETCKYIIGYLYETITRMATVYIKNQSELDYSLQFDRNKKNYLRQSYCMGIASTLNKKLMNIKESRNHEKYETTNGTDLIVIKDAALKQFVASIYPNLSFSKSSSSNINSDAYSQGRMDGENIHISSSIRNNNNVQKSIAN